MRDTLRLSILQMTSAASHLANVRTLRDAAARAAREGAETLARPAVAGLFDRNFDIAAEEDDPQ